MRKESVTSLSSIEGSSEFDLVSEFEQEFDQVSEDQEFDQVVGGQEFDQVPEDPTTPLLYRPTAVSVVCCTTLMLSLLCRNPRRPSATELLSLCTHLPSLFYFANTEPASTKNGFLRNATA